MSGQNPNQSDPAVPGDGEAEERVPSGTVGDEPVSGEGTGGEAADNGGDDLLTVSVDDLELPAPVLGEAEISADVAAEASLDEVVAEARSVEQEAQEAGTLAGGRLPGDPTSPNQKSDDAVAQKIEAAALKAKADLADKSLGDPAASAQSPGHEASSNAGAAVDEPDTAAPRSTDTGKGGEYEDDSVAGSNGGAVEDYPSAPDADENPQEPVSEPGATSPPPDDASAGPRKPGADDESGTAERAGSYPATPDGSEESKPRRDKGDGPGAAKISDPHEREYPERRRGRRAVNPPPAPDRLPGQQPAGEPSAPQSQYQPPSPWEGQISAPPASVRERPKKSKAPLFIGLGIALALVLGVVLLIIALSSLFSNGSGDGQQSAEDDVIAENVSPFDFRQGQCFTDFTDATQPATVVDCNSPHEAQLVNTFIYEDDAEFPGEEELINRADELCRTTQLNDAAQNYELRQQTAYPQPESWTQGDRRVDCFIRVPDGGLTESLID